MNDRIISDIEYNTVYIPLLIKLAQRNTPGAKYWWLDSNDPSVSTYVTCLICNKSIFNGNDFVDLNQMPIRAHGIWHIKKSNLLPFL